MTTLIELHDHNIRISSPEGLLGESPGFANTAEKTPVFGEEALKLTRLHPQQNFNQFWFQLSLDPLASKNKHFRHQADLAFGHLTNLSSHLDLSGDAIFAVPSHYSGTQLATLLGLAKHCSFDAAGLVDLSLLALASLNDHQHALFMDVQLHQTVLTLVTKEGGEILRKKVFPIPGTGLLALHDAWVSTITDAFIKQNRFDPLHNADTEQYIYNELQSWLASVSLNKEILLEINNKGTVFQASLSLKNFEQRAQSIFQRVASELNTISKDNTPVYTLDRIASLPGLTLAMPHLVSVSDSTIAENAYQHLELIKGDGTALKLVSRLPVSQTAAPAPSKVSLHPTHFLYEHKAYPLSDLNLPDFNLSSPIKVSSEAGAFLVHPNQDAQLEINTKSVQEPSVLALGDRLTINNSFTLDFIQVQ